jgi:hypothetical protein
MQQDQLIFTYPRRQRWLVSLGVLIFGISASLVFLLSGRLTDDRLALGALLSLFALLCVFRVLDSITAFTMLDAQGIQTRSSVFVRRACGWWQVKTIDVHTTQNFGPYGVPTGHSSVIRCILIDGKEFTLVNQGRLNGNAMDATTQRIIAYWHGQYPVASGAVSAG